MPNLEEIAKRAKSQRILSNYEISEIASRVGLTESDYESFEEGKRSIDVSVFFEFCRLIGSNPESLLNGPITH